MKSKLLLIIMATMLFVPKVNFGQAPNLGTAANFALFTTVGLVRNDAVYAYNTHITGNVGSNSGAVTLFGNVDGVMAYPGNAISMQAQTDLLVAEGQLDAAIQTNVPPGISLGAPGAGQTLFAGVHEMTNPTLTLDNNLNLDAQNDPTKVFIFKMHGAFNSSANAKVRLINGALACNVFWITDGAVNLAANTTMKGTIVARGAVHLAINDSLEGRVLVIGGEITVLDGMMRTPIGCNSPALTGPVRPNLATLECFTIFSSNGALTNTLPSATSIGDVGNNGIGAITGWDASMVTGTLHNSFPDAATAQAAIDLSNVYNQINALPVDIVLNAPMDLGHNLVLTPHVYSMSGSALITDTIILNALGDANAVFVIKIIAGDLATYAGAAVKLINGAQSQNVFWMVAGGSGVVEITDNVTFRGNIIVPNGEINMRYTGVVLDGRAFTMVGAINTQALTAIMPPGCGASPIVVTDPMDLTVCQGDTAVFSVIATGDNLTYQWMNGNTPLVNSAHISGADSATLYINSAVISDTSSFYNVIVNGSIMPSDTSINVSLTVNIPPTITSQPSSELICAGDSAIFTVAATGTGLNYQWRKGLVNLIDGLNIIGSDSSTLIISPTSLLDTASNYNVVVSGACFPNDTSINVSLYFNAISNITSEPVSQMICAGDSAMFTVAATGTALTYQWRKGLVNLMNGLNISGADSDTLIISAASLLDTANNYNVVVSGTCSNDTSIDVSLYFNAISNITSQPVSQIVCAGDSAMFTVAASGTGLTYQWRRGLVNLMNGLNISGADSSTLVISAASLLDTANNYNVVVTGTCSNDTSINVSLYFNTNSNITTQPVNQVVCAGDSVMFTVAATGTGLTYQWRKGLVNLMNGLSISGADSDSLSIYSTGTLDAASDYNVVVTGTCTNDTSVNVALVVNTAPSITLQPVSQVVCAGDSVTFTVAATGTGLTYQWRKGSSNLSNSGNIAGADSSTLVIYPSSVTDTANNYNVIVMGTCAPNDTSVNVSLTVNPIPVATANSNSPVCAGDSINLTAQTVVGATYLWTGPNGFSSMAQDSVILVSTLSNAGVYSLVVTSNGCSSAPSTVTVVVNTCIADLSVVKTVNNSTPFIGTTVVFTIVASNNGPNDATQVVVNDMLQSGYAYVSSSATAGTYNASTGIWTIGAMINSSTETLTLTVTVLATGSYVNTTDISGNETDLDMTNNTSSVEPVPTDFNIPEGFSPNGDGINDLFVIRGIQNYTDNTFMIFNRWGNKMFEANSYMNTWNGTSTSGLRVGGNELPVGTYFYILDLKDGSDVFKGTIYLNR